MIKLFQDLMAQTVFILVKQYEIMGKPEDFLERFTPIQDKTVYTAIRQAYEWATLGEIFINVGFSIPTHSVTSKGRVYTELVLADMMRYISDVMGYNTEQGIEKLGKKTGNTVRMYKELMKGRSIEDLKEFYEQKSVFHELTSKICKN